MENIEDTTNLILSFIAGLNVYYKEKEEYLEYDEYYDSLSDCNFISLEIKTKKNTLHTIVLRVRCKDKIKAIKEFEKMFFTEQILKKVDYYMNGGSYNGMFFKNLDS